MNTQLSRRDLLRYSAIGVGTAAIFGLAGCAPTSTGVVAAPGDGPTDFTFGSWSLSEDAAKAPLQGAIDAFAGTKNVSASTVSYPYNDYLNQLTLQVRGGQFAGAAQLDVAWLSAMVALGKLSDLSEFSTGRGYTSAALGAGQFDGVQYGLPWTIGAIGPVLNQELFEKAGASVSPATIEEFEEGLRALKGINVIPYAAATKAAGLKDILVWMQTFGSPIIKDGKSTLGDAESVAAVKWYKKLFDDGLIAPDVDRSAARTLFAQGTTAMYDDAPVGKSAVTGQSSDSGLGDKMTSMARPVLASGDTPQHVLWGHLIVVAEGEGSATAAEFAQWITSDDDQTVAYFESLGLPPTTQTALKADAVAANTYVADFTSRVTSTATSSPLWIYPGYSQMETAIAEQVQAVLIGQSSAADAMATAGAKVNSLIR
ncbi:extracellular solute-binding protein [Salinibacterium sp. G-O1]|uniref:ABC transporter substrate-binding protein n=1 Tax=Salinibacterium sp. G-O1 TaxID=3046208 RepID=UPI0024BAA06D|nr:extracellular solute-binding protein [Salinibacterium sp. G-O1]MDJ0333655.1 extracellular solute-binding protein [Salinibacterium sp. G-O1]